MSILQVANVQFDSTGANRIEYTGNNVIRVKGAGLQLPVVTNATKPSPEAGMMLYNSDTGNMEMMGADGAGLTFASNTSVASANNYAGSMANSVNTYTSATYSTLTQFGSVFGVANAAFAAGNAEFTFSNTIYAAVNSAFGVINAAFARGNTSAQLAFFRVAANGSNLDATSNADTLTIRSSNNIILIANSTNDSIQITQNPSGVTATTYGGSTNIPVIVVDAFGRITSAANQSFSAGGVTSVSGTAGRITSSGGSTPAIDLATAGAGAATYSTGISAITVDAYGRVTSVTGSAGYLTGITSGQVTGALGYTPYNSTNPSGYITSSALSPYAPLAGATFTGLITGRVPTTSGVGGGNDAGSMSIRGDASKSAHISFHRAGAYAINMGLDTDNVFRIGGWSDGATTYRLQLATPGGTSTLNGILSATSDMRAPIFYDSDNTAYYVNPNGTTYLAGDLYVGMALGASNIYMGDTDEGTRRIHCNSNRIGFLNQSDGWGSWCQDEGWWGSDQSIRAPLFYDLNDTYYYNDLNSSRRFAGRTYIHEWIEFVNHTGLYSPINGAHFYPNNGSYGSWRIDGSRNGWQGIEFSGQTTLMMNDNGQGFHRNIGGGWRFYVESGNGYFPGNVSAYWSDRRLKENLRTIGSESIKILSKMTAYRFNWNDKVKNFCSDIEPGKEEIGLIAQEVQAVLPDAVVVNKSANISNPDGTEEQSDYLTINWNKITPLLVQALNDTTKELAELKQLLKDKGIL